MNAFIIVGKGGREHALATLLARSHQVYSFGASDAIRRVAPPLDEGLTVNLDTSLSEASLRRLVSHPGSIIVFGPEQPMAAGWVDQIRLVAPDQAVLAPPQFAAQLESSKWWAKEFMLRNNVPTGAAHRIRQPGDFDRFALQFEPPYVIKADGLAAGKGVALFDDAAAAREFTKGILDGTLFGAPQKALIEEYLDGPELSIFLLLDGAGAVQIGTARDYKRALDNDEGANTGGMGSFTPVPDVSAADQDEIYRTILRPILDGLKKDAIFYRGFLYVGLMRTKKGFRVLEFNVRMGDPETQAVLPVIETQLPELLIHAAAGDLASLRDQPWIDVVSEDFMRVRSERAAVCLVLAAPGYPGAYKTGAALTDLARFEGELSEGEHVFHAGTVWKDRVWATNGGRVLNFVATGTDIPSARARCYAMATRFNCPSLRNRTDIASGG